MIRLKRIKKIEDFGIFQNFSWDSNTRDFSTRNIIYGWNYSGKTTLSRFIEAISIHTSGDIEAPKYFIDIDNNGASQKGISSKIDVPIFVFNNTYIERNLHFHTYDNPKIKGVLFDIGEESSDKRKLLRETQERIKEIKDWLEKNSDDIRAFEEFEKIFSTAAKNIKNDVFESSIEFTKAHLKRELQLLNQSNLSAHIISNPTELATVRFNALQKNPMSPISFNCFLINFNELTTDINECLLYCPGRVKTETILEQNNGLYNAVREFLNFYNSNSTYHTCAFCGNIISETRIDELNTYYTNEASQLRQRIEKLKTVIYTHIHNIDNSISQIVSANDLIESARSSFENATSKYQELLGHLKNFLDFALSKLNEKLNKYLFESMLSIKAAPFNYEAYCNVCDELNQIITIHNNNIANFNDIKIAAISKLKLHHVAKLLKERNYFQIKSRRDIQENERSRKNIELQLQTDLVSKLQSELTSIVKGQEKLNNYIKLFLGREELSIKATDDNFFLLYRGAEIARNLSEGEKSAIAFSYFLVYLENIKEMTGLNDAIIFIDDPISSLDNNHIAQVSSLINNFFFYKDSANKTCDNFAQLFIATHNFEFFSFVRDANNIKRKNNDGCCNLYMLKRSAESKVELLNLPKAFSNYDSEYLYLFSEIYNYYNSGCPVDSSYIMPNVIRRFLEIYTRIKLPGNHDEIDNRLKILTAGRPNELKFLHYFSHFTTLERAVKHSELILKIPDITSDVIAFLKLDKEHYDSLVNGISAK